MRFVCRFAATAISVSILAAGVILGCDRAPVTSPATAPTTGPARADSTTSPSATTQPRVAYMLVDQKRVEFPPAKLVVKTKGDGLHALLYSDDPPDAIDDRYAGNSFYLEMSLDDETDPQQLGTTKWVFKAPDSERSDTVSGIYLDGRKHHLQPFDVVVEFDQRDAGAGASGTNPAAVKVWISGQFMLFDSSGDPTIPGQIMRVAAELDAELTINSR